MTSLRMVVLLAGLMPAFAWGASLADVEFVSKAAQSNLAEIEVGNLAVQQGTSPDIKAFGERMVADHGQAYQGLKQAAEKSQTLVPAKPNSAQTQAAEELKGLEGAAFDTKYAQMMVKDHEEAVALFRKQGSTGSDADLKAYASSTLPKLESHLEMAKALKP